MIEAQAQRLADDLARIRERIHDATARRHVGEGSVTLVGASKNVPADRLRQACAFGLTRFGENYVQEAVQKMPWLAGIQVEWHLIGHLQSNKAARALGSFENIQSIDDLALARLLSRHAHAAHLDQVILLEVNVGAESQKFGFAPEAVPEAAAEIAALPGLVLKGMMVMPPALPPEQVRPHFAGARACFEELRRVVPGCDTLSMGMSDDFEVAIEEGSTMVRVGRALFGSR